MFHLTAIQDFGNYKRGDHIEDAAEVERILAGEHAVLVVKMAADSKPVEEVKAETGELQTQRSNFGGNFGSSETSSFVAKDASKV